MLNMQQQLTVNLISVKAVSVEGKDYLTLWVYQQADGSNKQVAGGEVMKLSANPELHQDFRKLFDGVKDVLVPCDILVELKTGAAMSTKLHVIGVKATAKNPNPAAKAA